MRKRRYFASAGEKRKFFNNMRHFGRTRDIGLAGMALMPALLPIALVAMFVFAACVFFAGTSSHEVSRGFGDHLFRTAAVTQHLPIGLHAPLLGMAVRMSIQLKEDHLKLTNDYRAILNKSQEEKRDLTPEEKTTLATMDKDFEKLEGRIAMHVKQEEREAAAAAGNANGRSTATQPSAQANKPTSIRGSEEYGKTFNAYLRNGSTAIAAATPEIRAALQADSDTAGGYMAPSEQFSNNFIQFVNNLVFIRQLATKETVTSAQSLGIPTLASDPDDADWTSELGTGQQDPSMSFGKRELYPHPLAKQILVSNKLLRMTPQVDNKVMERLAYKFAVAEEKAFLNGNGAEQPLGVFTASANGITTGRDVVTGSVNSILADSLFDAMYTLKAQYQAKAVWIFHRDGIRQIRKLKDTQNRYLWEPAITAGQPDLILGRPFYMSEYCPNTFTTGLYVGIVGDFSKYVIADALSMGVQRLVELYAASNQTGFIGRQEVDGMPVLEEAFVRLKTS
jgi:HK97 family phage major capsid protein